MLAIGDVTTLFPWDIDADGFIDLAFVGYHGMASVIFGAGDGTLADAESFGSTDVNNGCVADFDGDGTDDVVAPGPTVLLVLGGESSRTLTTIDDERSGRLCTTGDFDRDGLMDVVVATFEGAVSVYFARADSGG